MVQAHNHNQYSYISAKCLLGCAFTEVRFPWAGVIPASTDRPEQQLLHTDDDKASSQFSFGSDALTRPWFQKQSSLDMRMCCNMTCMALAVLHRMKRYHTLVQVSWRQTACQNIAAAPMSLSLIAVNLRLLSCFMFVIVLACPDATPTSPSKAV